MPIFDIECKSCTKVTEVLLKINQEDVKCPHCNSENTVKLIGAPVLRFKGKDFYASEYKRGGDKRDSLTANNRSIIYGDN